MITSENAATFGRPFTTETGRLAGMIGGTRPKPKRAKSILTLEEKTRQNAVNRQLKLVREQICLTRARLNDKDYRYCEHCERGGMPDNHRAQLLKALDALCERECDLLAIPGRGSRRPAQEAPRRKTYTDAGPTAIAQTTTQSVPAPSTEASNPNPLTDNKTD